MSGPGESRSRIVDVKLDEAGVIRRSPDVEHERKVAMFDLLEENHFAPIGVDGGPFRLRLAIEDNRLVFDIRDEADAELARVGLPITPMRRLVKDYFKICESYFQAIKSATPSKIEAIDMGRRGLHNEGSEMLRELLAEKVELDFDTARRLFTLVCVLHIRA
ncbi:UPF0262 family protein [Oceanibacterium hippocampi]|uniref:UPF0262 protein OCH7691_01113 n=1 Tax=Oceanibacterium hippocampi TaxID=745714 RepID=A0A1Y5S4Q3_9PROT|nr:UPF0262 family protein [Oceanibacterium hippocampi]SLN31263.1 hypothetical protein OCH7691_01113 [Oceanibacterium hippocampi]